MIDSLRNISRRLVFLNPVAVAMMLLAFIGVVYCLVSADTELAQRYLAPAIVALLWAGSLYSMINIFPNVPTMATKETRFISRITIAIKRFFYRLLAVVFVATTLATVYVGYQLIKIWVSDT